MRGKPIDQIKDEFKCKVEVIDSKFLYEDLVPLLGSATILDGFIDSYREYMVKYIDMVV